MATAKFNNGEEHDCALFETVERNRVLVIWLMGVSFIDAASLLSNEEATSVISFEDGDDIRTAEGFTVLQGIMAGADDDIIRARLELA